MPKGFLLLFEENLNASRPSEHPQVIIGCKDNLLLTSCVLVVVVLFFVVFFTLTDRVSTIPSNTRGCQSGTWSAGQKKIRGTSTKLQ